MSDDIVERLRFYANLSIDGGWATVFRSHLNKAVDEIERLRKERDELQKWKDAHNTFWRDRAERRDAMRENGATDELKGETHEH